MRTPDERVTELHRRIGVLERARSRRALFARCAACGAVCAALSLAVLAARGVPTGGPAPAADGMPATGSAFRAAGGVFGGHGTAGAVAVAVAAFALGALVTLLCSRLRKNAKAKETRR